jgi:hypothetical protein
MFSPKIVRNKLLASTKGLLQFVTIFSDRPLKCFRPGWMRNIAIQNFAKCRPNLMELCGISVAKYRRNFVIAKFS